MSNIRDMINAIENEDFDCARNTLKASLAEYMAGKQYVSNNDVFGDSYNNPNDEEQKLKAELTESTFREEGEYKCNDCGEEFSVEDINDEVARDDDGDLICPSCSSGNLKQMDEE